jgi:hypothetical protein
MGDLMLYPIWQRLPRPPHFPEDPTLDRLLASNYDPRLDGFKLSLRRREARDLRKGVFGPKGSRVVPKFSGDLDEYDGVMEFDLPKGWRLRLDYHPAQGYDFERHKAEAGLVEAEFIPPRARQWLGRTEHGTSLAA